VCDISHLSSHFQTGCLEAAGQTADGLTEALRLFKKLVELQVQNRNFTKIPNMEIWEVEISRTVKQSSLTGVFGRSLKKLQ